MQFEFQFDLDTMFPDKTWYFLLLEKYGFCLPTSPNYIPGIELGEVILPPLELVIDIFEIYAQETSKYIENEKAAQELESKNSIWSYHHPILRDFMYQRACSYREFLSIKSGHFDDEDLEILAGIIDHEGTPLSKFSSDKQGYVKAMQELNLPCWDYFLSFIPYELPYRHLATHSYLVAKTQSGKSELIKTIIHGLQKRSYEDSIILIDPHGDLAEELKNLTLNGADPERLIYFDPFFKKGYTPKFNPFDIADRSEESIYLVAQNLLLSFKELFKDFADISGDMGALLLYCIPVLLHREGSDIYDLVRFMADDPELIELGKASPYIDHAKYFKESFHKVKRSSKEAIARRVLKVLATPSFSRMVTGRNLFNLEEAMNSGMVIIFNLSASGWDMEQTSLFGRFLVSFIKSIAIKRGEMPKEERPRTFLFIDEFQYFTSPNLEKVVSQMAKYNLNLFVAHQNEDQVNHKLLSSLISNTHVKIVGNASSDTYSFVADDMRLSKKELLERLKRFHFYVRSGEEKALLIKSSDKLLDPKNYLTGEEQKLLDELMLERYYMPITDSDNLRELNAKFGFDD